MKLIVTPGRLFQQDPRAISSDLAGLTILVAEDEFLLAAQIEDELRSASCSVLGPCTSVAQALQTSRAQRFDLALLDINLRGEMIYPVIDELRSRRVPFVLLSGYSAVNLPERLRDMPRVAKPHDPAMLLREMRRALGKI